MECFSGRKLQSLNDKLVKECEKIEWPVKGKNKVTKMTRKFSHEIESIFDEINVAIDSVRPEVKIVKRLKPKFPAIEAEYKEK